MRTASFPPGGTWNAAKETGEGAHVFATHVASNTTGAQSLPKATNPTRQWNNHQRKKAGERPTRMCVIPSVLRSKMDDTAQRLAVLSDDVQRAQAATRAVKSIQASDRRPAVFALVS